MPTPTTDRTTALAAELSDIFKAEATAGNLPRTAIAAEQVGWSYQIEDIKTAGPYSSLTFVPQEVRQQLADKEVTDEFLVVGVHLHGLWTSDEDKDLVVGQFLLTRQHVADFLFAEDNFEVDLTSYGYDECYALHEVEAVVLVDSDQLPAQRFQSLTLLTFQGVAGA